MKLVGEKVRTDTRLHFSQQTVNLWSLWPKKAAETGTTAGTEGRQTRSRKTGVRTE